MRPTTLIDPPMGDLTAAALGQLPTPALTARYTALWGRAPRFCHRVWLIKRILFKAEEARLGGLSCLARQRLNALMAEIDLPLSDPTEAPSPGPVPALPNPVLGASVSRIWRSQEHRATRVDGGWEYEDQIFSSLSALAKHITGAHWNGRLFFGLTPRKTRRTKR